MNLVWGTIIFSYQRGNFYFSMMIKLLKRTYNAEIPTIAIISFTLGAMPTTGDRWTWYRVKRSPAVGT